MSGCPTPSHRNRNNVSPFNGHAAYDPPVNVRFYGRYWGESGHELVHCTCPLLTQSGHQAGKSPAQLLRPKSRRRPF